MLYQFAFQQFQSFFCISIQNIAMFDQYNQQQIHQYPQKEKFCESFQEIKIRQLSTIQKQSELMLKISKMLSSNHLCLSSSQSLESQISEHSDSQQVFKSTSSIFSLSYDLNNYSAFHRQNRPFASKTLKCLSQIKEKCSVQCYNFVIKLSQKDKGVQKMRVALQKQKRLKEEQIQQNLKLNCLIQNLQNKIIQINQTIQNYRNQQFKMKKVKDQMQSTERKLLKKQEALIYKQKINREMKEKLQIKFQQFKNIQCFLESNIMKDQNIFPQSRESPQEVILCKNQGDQTTLDISGINQVNLLNQYKKLEEYFDKLNKLYCG